MQEGRALVSPMPRVQVAARVRAFESGNSFHMQGKGGIMLLVLLILDAPGCSMFLDQLSRLESTRA